MQFDLTSPESEANLPKSMHFCNQFEGCMELSADRQRVSQYLDQHQGWFRRCARPMQVEPIGENGYGLTIGRYGSFGFEIEPHIDLHLLPQQEGTYRIETIPALTDEDRGYQVDFQASLRLMDDADDGSPNQVGEPLPPLTRVEWDLDLGVAIVFPGFIRRLPIGLIQYTGDQILKRIVRQVSQRLMAKVQADFHATLEGSSV